MNLILEAPCVWCGYNGPEYWQSGSHHKKCPWRKVGGGAEREAQLRSVISKRMGVIAATDDTAKAK